MDDNELIAYARDVLKEEAKAIQTLASHIDEPFINAARLLLSCEGRVVVSGTGKSGHVARKFASTLASTGTPSFFVHPAECLHGDFGMIAKNDMMVFISKSGESREVLEIVPYLKRFNIPLIAICNNPDSLLAQNATITLLLHIEREVCPLNLAPTTSSTVTLALCDAIAVTLMKMRGFSESDYAVFHPGGSLGKQLTKVSRIMHSGAALPLVKEHIKLKDALMTIIEKRLGVAIIVDAEGYLRGIVVDGDLKRLLVNDGVNVLEKEVRDVMTKTPKTIAPDAMLGEALAKMEGVITSLVVVENGRPVGLIRIHDILMHKAV
ncbi:MAG: KpsF/GutQ family sugar-phosphate isomerase [Spirochaetes bacterium]|nr:KpsF/GutQ family sugar-phosphate isomerase [Spirochaetota bacterium]